MSTLPIGRRRVLVTGAGSGIGAAVAESLLSAGGMVAAVGRREAPLRELEASYPGKVAVLPRDLGKEADRGGLLALARERLGGLDGMVHCAGAAFHELPGAIEESSLRAQIELHFVAPLRLGEQALEILDPGGGVVFLGSTLGERPIETSAVYSGAKAAMVAAMRSLALAGSRRDIRFNVVSPGLVDTPMSRALRLAPGEAPPSDEAERKAREEAQLRGFAELHPLGRLGSPVEVAEVVLELLAARWVTGADWRIDGGLLLR